MAETFGSNTAALSAAATNAAAVLRATQLGVDVKITAAANVVALLSAASYAAIRALLDLEAGTDFYSKTAADAAFQPLSANLSEWAGCDPSSNGKSLVAAADYAAMRALLDLEAGTDFLAYSAFHANGITLVGQTFAQMRASLDLEPGVDFYAKGAMDTLLAGKQDTLSLSITTEGSPAAGDFLVVVTAEGDLRKVDWDDLPAGGGGGGITTEQALDAVGAALTDSSTIDFTFNDGADTITAIVIDGSIVTDKLANDAVTYAKMQDVSATSRFIGRKSSGAGDPEELSPSDARTILQIPEVIIVSCSDETTDITTGTAKVTFRMPFAMTLTGVKATVTAIQSSGSIFTVDINEAGSTILSTKLTIDNSEKTSATAATPAVISDTALADDAEITIDVDQVGTGTKGLKVYLIGYRA